MKPTPLAISHTGQHNDENGPFEVFWFAPEHSIQGLTDPGWYWWSCHPGCLPDGEAQGPFDTSLEAYNSAKDLDFSYNKDDLPPGGGPDGQSDFEPDNGQ